MRPQKIAELAARWAGGYVSALARIFGVNIRTMQRWHTGEQPIHPLLDLLDAFYERVEQQLGPEKTKALFYDATLSLGRTLFHPNKPPRPDGEPEGQEEE